MINQKEHGLFNIEIEDNLLLVQFFDAWNYDQANCYNQEVKRAAASLVNKPWARIIDLTHWEGGGEETIAPIGDLHRWSLQNNCQLVVFINPPLVPKYMLEKYGDPYGNYEIFQSLNEAKSWVMSKLNTTE